MSNLQQIKKGQVSFIGIVFLLAVSLSSCKKDQNNDVTTIPSALISVIDASPDAGALDFYLDNNKANNTPIVYGSGLDYLRAYTGKRTAMFYLSGTTQKVKADTMTLKDGKFYSLFLSNVASKPDYLLTTDTLTNPGTSSASIRVVNLSPDAPTIDLVIQGGATLATNKAYRTLSSFATIAPGTYTFEFRQRGTTTVLATLSSVRITGASIYTVWLQGLASSTVDATKLNARVQLNAYFY